MYINGGGNPLDYNNPPSDIDEVVSKLAVSTKTIGVALHQIPNQPIYFKGLEKSIHL
jgi:PhoPQ-activated pathogenicity-related protein